MSADDLVVGDLIQFALGNKLPADCIMVSGQDVQCLEDELTGEPDEKDKEPVTFDNYQ
jgi:P-type E1-E2 ATPase